MHGKKKNYKQICLSLLKIDMKKRMEIDRMKNKNILYVKDMIIVIKMFPFLLKKNLILIVVTAGTRIDI